MLNFHGPPFHPHSSMVRHPHVSCWNSSQPAKSSALSFPALPHALAHALVHALVHALGHHGHHALLHPSHHRLSMWLESGGRAMDPLRLRKNNHSYQYVSLIVNGSSFPIQPPELTGPSLISNHVPNRIKSGHIPKCYRKSRLYHHSLSKCYVLICFLEDRVSSSSIWQ